MKANLKTKNKLMIFSLFVLLGINTSWKNMNQNPIESTSLASSIVEIGKKSELAGKDYTQSFDSKITGETKDGNKTFSMVTLQKKGEVTPDGDYYVYINGEYVEFNYDEHKDTQHKLIKSKGNNNGSHDVIEGNAKINFFKNLKLQETEAKGEAAFLVKDEDCDCGPIYYSLKGVKNITDFMNRYNKDGIEKKEKKKIAKKKAAKKKKKTATKSAMLAQLKCEKEITTDDEGEEKLVKIKTTEDKVQCLARLLDDEDDEFANLMEQYNEDYDPKPEITHEYLADHIFSKSIYPRLRALSKTKNKGIAIENIESFIATMKEFGSDTREYVTSAKTLLTKTKVLNEYDQFYAKNKAALNVDVNLEIMKLHTAKQSCGYNPNCIQMMDFQIRQVMATGEATYKKFQAFQYQSKLLISDLERTKYNKNELKDLAKIFNSQKKLQHGLVCGTRQSLSQMHCKMRMQTMGQMMSSGQNGQKPQINPTMQKMLAQTSPKTALAELNSLSRSQNSNSGADILSDMTKDLMSRGTSETFTGDYTTAMYNQFSQFNQNSNLTATIPGRRSSDPFSRNTGAYTNHNTSLPLLNRTTAVNANSRNQVAGRSSSNSNINLRRRQLGPN